MLLIKTFAYAHKIKIGDHLQFRVFNTADRYFNKAPQIIELEVVGITNTYQTQELYISIKNATKFLKLPPAPFAERFKFDGFEGAFNGILTNQQAPREILTQIVQIYSPSRLYPVDER